MRVRRHGFRPSAGDYHALDKRAAIRSVGVLTFDVWVAAFWRLSSLRDDKRRPHLLRPEGGMAVGLQDNSRIVSACRRRGMLVRRLGFEEINRQACTYLAPSGGSTHTRIGSYFRGVTATKC